MGDSVCDAVSVTEEVESTAPIYIYTTYLPPPVTVLLYYTIYIFMFFRVGEASVTNRSFLFQYTAVTVTDRGYLGYCYSYKPYNVGHSRPFPLFICYLTVLLCQSTFAHPITTALVA